MMNIFNYFKRIGIDTVDAAFYRKIAEWISWYRGAFEASLLQGVYRTRQIQSMQAKEHGNG